MIPLHLIAPGQHRLTIESRLPEARRAYQVEGGRGLWPRNADVVAVPLDEHLSRSASNLHRAIPLDAPPGLVSMDAEPHNLWHNAATRGELPEGWPVALASWVWSTRQRLRVSGDGWIMAAYPWPQRFRDAVRSPHVVRSSEMLAPVWSVCGAVTPSLYDLGDEHHATQAHLNLLRLTLAEARRICDGHRLLLIPQVSPFVRGGYHLGLAPIDRWRRELEAIVGFGVDGVALWLDAKSDPEMQAACHALDGEHGAVMREVCG
ncbi:MAG TPA: hypothetical protein PLU35_13820 [Phycisphaerales bacterium]|nr:hypothetical protein [Phycisphaerales bacterium]